MKQYFRNVLIVTLSVVLIFSTTFGVCTASAKDKVSDEEYIESLLDEMTLKEKIAQMLFVYVPKEDAKKKQKKHQYGGYLLFADNFKKSNPDKISTKIGGWQKVSKISMLIGVDEEGGTVVRVSKFKQFRSKPYKSPRKLAKLGGYKLIKEDASNKSNTLKKLGINTNLAPVADVTYSSRDFMYQRTFSNNAKKTAKYIHTVVPMMNKRRVVGTLKHFPGYGGNGDTHKKIIVDKRKLRTFKSRDLLPFEQGIKDGVPMIMVNHNIVNAFDKKHPASMSKKVHQYLREDMKFDGIIITDGLGMKGVVNKYGSNEEVAVRAVKAGNDMLCTPYGVTSVNAIYQAVKDGEISEKRINASVRRILRVKLKYGIIKK
ncbi:MAG: beta-hexosaminidase [Ruminococcaceae bacterium]|nr:beta-hexosaminidase [Oscillospiraceae bacterium]